MQLYPFPAGRPLAADWEYRPIGPFAVENYALGSYAAVLALRFLTLDEHGGAVWVPAVELKDATRPREYDFAAFIRERVTSDSFTLVGGECKCGKQRFLPKDLGACESFVATFPGAAFCFVTTRPLLDSNEKRRIGALARRGWKLQDGQWRNPVLVLTRRELEAQSTSWSAWNDGTDDSVKLFRSDKNSTKLERLARATQRLYLDLEPPTNSAERATAQI